MITGKSSEINKPANSIPQGANDGFSPFFAHKTMKEKKKQYLRNKKLKRQGKLDNDDDYLRAEQREKEIMTDRSKPVFGEQAKQPIKVSVSRYQTR